MNKNKKNIFFIYFFITLIFTIPIESKISIQKIPKRLSKIFTRTKKEEHFQKEFQNIKFIELFCEQGDITIHTWKQSSTLVEVKKYGNTQQLTQTLININQHEQLLQIQTECTDHKNLTHSDIHIIIPESTNIKIATKYGNIYMKNLLGTVEAQTECGNIEFIDGIENTTLKTLHGNITIQTECIQENNTLTAHANHGNIIVHVPQHINCTLHAETKHGKIYSDLFVTLKPITTKLDEKIYKQQQRLIYGTIFKQENDPIHGIINLYTQSGTIKIKPYM